MVIVSMVEDGTPLLVRYTGPVVSVSSDPVLLLRVDRDDPLALHEQLERRLREDVRSGRLAAGDPLPSTRTLAASLGVSRAVVTEAYSQLAAEGYLSMRQGAPVRVAAAIRAQEPQQPARSLLPRMAYDLRPGVPDLAGFPRAAWVRSLRTAWRDAPSDALGEGDPRGHPELRRTLAAYLRRARGAAADSEQTLVSGSFHETFSAVCRWLRSTGVRRVAVEDPGWHPHRLAIDHAGLDVVGVPVDHEGLCVDALAETGASAVVVTPAHHFPTGVTLGARRRAELVAWAEREEGLIIEDDYDGELRYDRGAVGALQGLAAERVLYLASTSKRLAREVGIGYALAPSWLTWPLTEALAVEAGGGGGVTQLALRDFIERGELDRHLRRSRVAYAARRAALVDALARRLPSARLTDAPAAGLFVLATLPEGTDDAALAARAAEAGVAVEPLSLHRYTAGPAGLVLGFAAEAEPSIDRAVALLADCAGGA
jgi:GntR family transcriptional regulator/MocR family aminotransferase